MIETFLWYHMNLFTKVCCQHGLYDVPNFIKPSRSCENDTKRDKTTLQRQLQKTLTIYNQKKANSYRDFTLQHRHELKAGIQTKVVHIPADHKGKVVAQVCFPTCEICIPKHQFTDKWQHLLSHVCHKSNTLCVFFLGPNHMIHTICQVVDNQQSWRFTRHISTGTHVKQCVLALGCEETRDTK